MKYYSILTTRKRTTNERGTKHGQTCPLHNLDSGHGCDRHFLLVFPQRAGLYNPGRCGLPAGPTDHERPEKHQNKGSEYSRLAVSHRHSAVDPDDIPRDCHPDHPCILQHHHQRQRQPPVSLVKGLGDHSLVRQGERLADRQTAGPRA